MIVVVSTPLRLLASYALTFAAGAVVAKTWRKSNRPTIKPAPIKPSSSADTSATA